MSRKSWSISSGAGIIWQSCGKYRNFPLPAALICRNFSHCHSNFAKTRDTRWLHPNNRNINHNKGNTTSFFCDNCQWVNGICLATRCHHAVSVSTVILSLVLLQSTHLWLSTMVMVYVLVRFISIIPVSFPPPTFYHWEDPEYVYNVIHVGSINSWPLMTSQG